ncbi:MAG: hypothetical protein IBJ00_04745 [Alphaproteobacteria bacterium]|nr:hypothetical protein [Alphaproteobacteria bacterium]
MKYSFRFVTSIMFTAIMTMYSFGLQASSNQPHTLTRQRSVISLKPASASSIAAYLNKNGVDTTGVSKAEQKHLLRSGQSILAKKRDSTHEGVKNSVVKLAVAKLEASNKADTEEKSTSFKEGNCKVHSLPEPFEAGYSTLRKPLGTGQELKETKEDILFSKKVEVIVKPSSNLTPINGIAFLPNNLRDVEGVRVNELSNPDKDYCTLRKPLRREEALEEREQALEE